MKIIKPLIKTSGMTLVSRVLGFFRDILIAASLGAGGIADVFFVAMRFPNIFRRVLAEGTLNISFIPLFSKKITNDDKKIFFKEIFNFIFWILIIIVCIFELFMPFFVYFLAPGFIDDKEKFDLIIQLARISFPYLFFISLVSLLCGVLTSNGKFTLAASMPIFLNLSMIITLLILINLNVPNSKQSVFYLTLSFSLSGLIQLLLCLYGCYKNGYIPSIRIPNISKNIKNFLHLCFPAIVAGGVIQINILIGTIIASFQDSAVSYLYYADRIYQLPLALIGISIGVVLLPQLSIAIKSETKNNILTLQDKSISLALLLAIPASFGLMFLSYDIISVLFERGFFTSEHSLATSRALMIFAAGLPAFISIKIFQTLFFARENTKKPLEYAIYSMILNALISIILFRNIGYMGIAIGTSISAWINLALLINESIKQKIYFVKKSALIQLLKIVVASFLMIILLYGLKNFTFLSINSISEIVNFLTLIVYVIIGIIFYGILCVQLKLIELNKILEG
tara:strand:- start:923 stop:2458 length:1536 start_codon:yes stop_codon:yes gene_type:complete